MLDIIIKNAKIVDGTGNPPFHGDIGIKNQQIVLVQPEISDESSLVLDINNKIAAPGFIEAHTHSDLSLFKYPQDKEKIMQGVTTALLGQDGLSVAPIDDANMALMKKRVKGLLGDHLENWTWRTLGEYLAELKKIKPATNNLMLVPHGNLRAMTVGWEARPATFDELSKMKQLLIQSLEEGAVGLSTGLVYAPAMYACRNELLELCKTTAGYGGFLVVHIRNESSNLEEALKEVIDICRQVSCPLHISHFKAGGKHNWGKSGKYLQMIDDARSAGLDLTFDQYPYVAGSTMLDAIMPPDLHQGGTGQMLSELSKADVRTKLREIFATPTTAWENLVNIYGFENIMITAVAGGKNKELEGHLISDLSQMLARDPVDLVSDLLIEEDNQVTMAVFFGSESDVENIMKHPEMCVCSDGILGGKPHPRLYGSFPKIIGEYVRDKKILTLEDAVKKMTGNPARRLKLTDRGLIKEGMQADITVFDFDKIIDRGTFKNPCQYPQGIIHVLVNGSLALQDGELTGNRNGHVICK
jgi:N-acyl-D-amino-acid deacylase